MHKRTDTPRAGCQDGETPTECGDKNMLFIVGIVIALIGVIGIQRMRLPGDVNSANLGWMSEQWLAEHRASHSV